MSLNALDPKNKLFSPEVTETLNKEIRRIDDLISNTNAPELKAKSRISDIKISCKGGNVKQNSSIKIDSVIVINCCIEAEGNIELTVSENMPEVYWQCWNSSGSESVAHIKGNKIKVKNSLKQTVCIYGYIL